MLIPSSKIESAPAPLISVTEFTVLLPVISTIASPSPLSAKKLFSVALSAEGRLSSIVSVPAPFRIRIESTRNANTPNSAIFVELPPSPLKTSSNPRPSSSGMLVLKICSSSKPVPLLIVMPFRKFDCASMVSVSPSPLVKEVPSPTKKSPRKIVELPWSTFVDTDPRTVEKMDLRSKSPSPASMSKSPSIRPLRLTLSEPVPSLLIVTEPLIIAGPGPLLPVPRRTLLSPLVLAIWTSPFTVPATKVD